MHWAQRIFLLSTLLCPALPASAESPAVADATPSAPTQTAHDGILFTCPPGKLEKLEAGMAGFLQELSIATELVVMSADKHTGTLLYTLNTPASDTNTLNLKDRPELQIEEEVVTLPAPGGGSRKVSTVSRKEIVLAMLQHGRLTRFRGAACNIEALKDHVAIRQNTVAWAEDLTWVWPDGESAEWNEKFWHKGTPKPGVSLHDALNDVFLNQDKYAIGCYTATKLVWVQGILDYYRRIKKAPEQLRLVEQRLMHDKDPLVGIEPGRMWDFEKGYDPQRHNIPGKLLKLKTDVMPTNFVPGDWVYFLNTDPVSYEKTGYEGSNAIYMGRNKFDDYYNDNNHSYSFFQKIDEVYQWRNGVFSRSRDYAKIKPLTEQDIELLSKRPAEGGLLKSIRATPYLFTYEDLPVLADQ